MTLIAQKNASSSEDVQKNVSRGGVYREGVTRVTHYRMSQDKLLSDTIVIGRSYYM